MLLTYMDYKRRGLKEQHRIITEEMNGVGDKDIHNLEYILYSIMPNSIMFRMGCIKSLRKAIKALGKKKETEKKERKHGSKTKKKFYIKYQSAEGYSLGVISLSKSEHKAITKFLREPFGYYEEDYSGGCYISKIGFDTEEAAYEYLQKNGHCTSELFDLE